MLVRRPELTVVVDGLGNKVINAIETIDYAVPSKAVFAAVRFRNGQRVEHRGDKAMFVAACVMVYDL